MPPAGENSGLYHLYKIYDTFEEMIKNTKWYEFLWRKRLKQTLDTLRYVGAIRGFETAIKDLEECGILKPFKNK